MGDEAFELEIGDRLGDRPPVQLLRVVELVPAGDAAGVEVADVLDVLLDGADDITLPSPGVEDRSEWREIRSHCLPFREKGGG